MSDRKTERVTLEEKKLLDRMKSLSKEDKQRNRLESIKINEKVFVSKIKNFINIYEEDYKDAKSLLNFTETNDFGFNFTHVNGTIIGTSEKDLTRNVYVQEIQVLYINETASVVTGVLTISVW